MRAVVTARAVCLGAAVVLYGEDGRAEYATAGGDSSSCVASTDDLVRVRRIQKPEKMSRAARRMAA
jgi:hypothetical protein